MSPLASVFVMCTWWCQRETKIPFFFLYRNDELPAQTGTMDQRHPWVQRFPRATGKAGHSWQHLHLPLSHDCRVVCCLVWVFFPHSFPEACWPGVWRDRNQEKRPFFPAVLAFPSSKMPPCHPGLKPTRFSCCTSRNATTLLLLPKHHQCVPSPTCPFLHLGLWVQWGCPGAPGQGGRWAGGCDEEEVMLPRSRGARSQP